MLQVKDNYSKHPYVVILRGSMKYDKTSISVGGGTLRDIDEISSLIN